MASLDPRGMVGRIYVGDHLSLLHTKYLSSGPHSFREEDFLSFSHYKSMGDMCCHGNQNSNPISPKILCSLSPPHLIMLHMKFDQDWPSGIREYLFEIVDGPQRTTEHWYTNGSREPLAQVS